MDLSQILAQHGIHLSQVQLQALAVTQHPVLLLAVPGSGKTTVLVARAAYLLSNGNSPAQICSLTFSRQSAADMQQRFQELFSDLFPVSPSFSTIHSLCWRILNEFSEHNGRTMPALTGNEATSSAAMLVRKCAESVSSTPLDDDQLRELLNKISLCKNRRLSRKEMQELSGMPDHFYTIYTLYEQQKKLTGLMDYDDLLLYTLEILEKRPAFLAQWQNRYQYWNIDEAQDLSPVQLELLRLLCPSGKGLFLVGDEDQSIYGFRGADPEGLLRFPLFYPDAILFKMEENHRSRPEILSLCESFIRRMPNRYDKRLLSTRSSGGIVERISPSSIQDSLQAVQELISDIPSGQSVGILYRSNLSACILSVFLREAGIPFRLDAEPITLLRSYTRGMYALLRVCANPYDLDAFHQTACRRALGTPLYENVFLRADGTKTIPSLLREAASRLPHRKNALELADTLDACATIPPDQALRLLETRSFLGRAAFSQWKSGDPLIRMRYTQFRWLCRTSPDYQSLWQRLEQAIQPTAYRPDEARITLSTIHSAKGLEFDAVLLLDAFDGILPARSALTDKMDGDLSPYYEEQRLFYVAATRARERLFLFDPPADQPNTRLSRFAYDFLRPSDHLCVETPFQEGDRIHHAGFGDGTIEKRSGDKIKILFDQKGVKNIALSFCIEKNLISKIDP